MDENIIFTYVFVLKSVIVLSCKYVSYIYKYQGGVWAIITYVYYLYIIYKC